MGGLLPRARAGGCAQLQHAATEEHPCLWIRDYRGAPGGVGRRAAAILLPEDDWSSEVFCPRRVHVRVPDGRRRGPQEALLGHLQDPERGAFHRQRLAHSRGREHPERFAGHRGHGGPASCGAGFLGYWMDYWEVREAVTARAVRLGSLRLEVVSGVTDPEGLDRGVNAPIAAHSFY